MVSLILVQKVPGAKTVIVGRSEPNSNLIEAVCVSLRANALERDMNPSFLSYLYIVKQST